MKGDMDPPDWTDTKRSRSQIFFKIGVLKNFAILTEKHLCWRLFLKKGLQHRCFPVNIAKFLRIAFNSARSI